MTAILVGFVVAAAYLIVGFTVTGYILQKLDDEKLDVNDSCDVSMWTYAALCWPILVGFAAVTWLFVHLLIKPIVQPILRKLR